MLAEPHDWSATPSRLLIEQRGGDGDLVAVVATMATHLSVASRIAIADQLRTEADMLSPPLDRRALH